MVTGSSSLTSESCGSTRNSVGSAGRMFKLKLQTKTSKPLILGRFQYSANCKQYFLLALPPVYIQSFLLPQPLAAYVRSIKYTVHAVTTSSKNT